MKKYIPYLIAVLLGIALLGLFLPGKNNRKRILDERVTLRRQDKIPYGTYAAFRHLPYLFPNAAIYTSRQVPGYWDSVSLYHIRQAYIVVTKRFNADEREMEDLITFVQNGNDVFVSAQYISAAADRYLKCSSSSYDLTLYSVDELDLGMTVSLTAPPYKKKEQYAYPGRSFNSYFTSVDSPRTRMLGYNGSGRNMFIHLKAGKGNFFVHLEPLAFSNYFLLHRENIKYYEKALSVIDPAVNKIIWDEYYLRKTQPRAPDEKKGWFRMLMSMKNEDGKMSFRAAFWLSILLLLLYVLMEMRRKQRYIPLLRKPKNDSLDFVRTIGRLYFDKGDHRNLSRKMGAYFLEHIRNKYKLATGVLDDEFIRNVSYKSGVSEDVVRPVVSFIRYTETAAEISENQLIGFYKQLESFYQNT